MDVLWHKESWFVWPLIDERLGVLFTAFGPIRSALAITKDLAQVAAIDFIDDEKRAASRSALALACRTCRKQSLASRTCQTRRVADIRNEISYE